jgi:hypothetical protein
MALCWCGQNAAVTHSHYDLDKQFVPSAHKAVTYGCPFWSDGQHLFNAISDTAVLGINQVVPDSKVCACGHIVFRKIG